MPSKAHTHRGEKAGPKQRPVRPTREDPGILGREQAHAAAIVQAGLDLRTLSPSNVMQLERAVGNQAAGRLLQETVQRLPDKESDTGVPDRARSGAEGLFGMIADRGQVTAGAIQRTKTPEERQKFLKQFPEAQALVEGIDVNWPPAQILAALAGNYQKHLAGHFKYTAMTTSAAEFLQGEVNGDCGTLADSFAKIADEYFDIRSVKRGHQDTPIYIQDPPPILDKEAKGNVDGKHWRFVYHNWAIGPGGEYDLLFGGGPVDRSKWKDKDGEGRTFRGIRYEDFGGNRVYRCRPQGPLADHFTLDYEKAKSKKSK